MLARAFWNVWDTRVFCFAAERGFPDLRAFVSRLPLPMSCCIYR